MLVRCKRQAPAIARAGDRDRRVSLAHIDPDPDPQLATVVTVRGSAPSIKDHEGLPEPRSWNTR